MKMNKHLLKVIGVVLLLAVITIAFVCPSFGQATSTGMDMSELERIRASNDQWALKYTNIASMLFGAGVASLVTGYLMKDNQNS